MGRYLLSYRPGRAANELAKHSANAEWRTARIQARQFRGAAEAVQGWGPPEQSWGGKVMGRLEPRSLDDEGLPLPPPAEGKASRWLLQVLVQTEKVMFMAIALALMVIAVIEFARGVHDLVLAPAHEPFAVTVTRAVNSVLFIVVVLELVRTIVARLEGGGFQLQPFLSSASSRRRGTFSR